MIQQDYFEYLREKHPEYLNHYLSRKHSINYIVDEFSSQSEEEYCKEIRKKDRVVCEYLQQYVKKIANMENIPLFNKIEIETINRCNNTCSFCPVNIKDDIRNHSIMSMSLFKKIILELSRLNYAKSISIFSNNEPLLDPNLYERLRFTREHLPNAYIYIYTNGLLLTSEKLLCLLKYVDYIHINNYNSISELLPGHKKLQETLIQNHVSFEKAEICLRNKMECLSSRAGQAPNRMKTECLSSPCILPFSQMVIRPDGKVSFCCNDAYGLYTMGDVFKESLTDIWYGSAFQRSRDRMLESRSTQTPCCFCDMIFMPLSKEN